jgi:hypothetical protein
VQLNKKCKINAIKMSLATLSFAIDITIFKKNLRFLFEGIVRV